MTQSAENIVFRYVLERHARQAPERTFATFPAEGRTWTWAEADAAANRMANALAELGVGRGSRVAVLSENSSAMVQVILGTTKLGAIYVPLHTSWRGEQLEHGLGIVHPHVIVCQVQYLESMAAVGASAPTVVIDCDTAGPDLDDLVARADSSSPEPPPDPYLDVWDPYAVIFTSGTTGRSKGVLCPYGQLFAQVEHPMLPVVTADDTFLGDMPLFHVGGLLAMMAVLQLGATWVVTPRIRIGTYWEIVRNHGVTHATLLPQVATFLQKQPERPDDAVNPLRIIMTGSFSRGLDQWCKRFGVKNRYRFYNSTELCAPLMTGLDPEESASTGHVRPGVAVDVIDSEGKSVERGTVGELIVRSSRPWEMFLGYLGDYTATSAAWTDGWFRSGDLFVQTGENTYQHVDRLADAIRRRGENISAFELEEVILRHPAVYSCAVVGVPDDEVLGDHDIKACVQPRKGETLDPAELVAFLDERLPPFAVPRYVDILEELPRTATTKIRKSELRSAGVTDSTWDRNSAGNGVIGRD
ncbi:ATP-dependent acyl-CoA ligase [Aeromicrobium panaciterrae]|uniref:AMP-binding protein n=1 Tax=Aeromicrobium panaciterrae TaxID=363861 RepID=UPI0031D151D5